MLHRLEIGSLFAVFTTLWAASVFLTYPHCEMDGASVAWCEFIAVVVGFSDVAVALMVIVLFLREKGAAKCLDACFKVRTRARAVSMSVGQGITSFDRVHGPEAVRARRQTRIREHSGRDDGVWSTGQSLGGHRIGATTNAVKPPRRSPRRRPQRIIQRGEDSGTTEDGGFFRGRGHGRERVNLPSDGEEVDAPC